MGFPKGEKRDFAALEKRRLEAVRLVVEEGLSQSEAARRVKAAQQSVSGWVKRYRQDGRAGLSQAGRAGRKPLLNEKQLAELESLLLEGPEAHGFPTPLWSCPRVARLIRRRFGVRYHEGHVWKLLRSLNWSPQRPVGKARERNEEAIRTWRKKTWPGIKKKPENKAARSFSSTKAD
jgi:transposase